MEAITKTRKLGGSLVVTVPRIVVEHENLMEDQTVTIDIKKLRRSGFGISKGKTSFSKEDKFIGQFEK